MQVAQIMTRDPEVVTSDFFLKDAALKIRELDVGMLPIRSEDRLVGMLTDRDITIRPPPRDAIPRTRRLVR
jgi:CBS domain-containing protein